MNIIDKNQYYYISDTLFMCCDEMQFQHYCFEHNEPMDCYYCGFDYNQPCDCE